MAAYRQILTRHDAEESRAWVVAPTRRASGAAGRKNPSRFSRGYRSLMQDEAATASTPRRTLHSRYGLIHLHLNERVGTVVRRTLARLVRIHCGKSCTGSAGG